MSSMLIGRIFFAFLLISFPCLRSADALESDTYRFPIRISSNGRYFEDQAGKPVLIYGDSAWSLIAQLDLKETEYYLDRRKAQGFNSILVNLIERKFSVSPPRNASGAQPFLEPGDISTPNEAYFAHADSVIKMAARKGMLVFLVPMYLGWKGGEEGWFQDVRIAGVEKVRAYGRFVGSRYKTYSNIVWVVGGDFTPPRQYRWSIEALAESIREGGAAQLMTAHCGQESPANAFGDRKWLDFSNVYSYARNLHVETLKEYMRHPVRPYILIESIYENENDATPDRIRQQAYESILTGAAGHFYGNNPVWNFGSPHKVFPTKLTWKESLNSRGAKDMSQLRALFERKRWNTLVPDTEHRFAVVGYGHEASGGYPTVAVTRDSGEVIVYIPTGAPSELYFNLKEVQSRNGVMCVDPANGEETVIDTLTHDKNGRKEISTAGMNSSGSYDWVCYFRMK